MTDVPFDRSVFVNCPFDGDYASMLQAIAFCIVYLGFRPRLAPENSDNAAARLDRIAELISSSKFAVHDLSRCRGSGDDDYVRMNMPFELGLDHACRRFGGGQLVEKQILILEQTRYDTQKALSDISGWDIQSHGGDQERAVKHVRGWLISQAGAEQKGAALIQGKYLEFQQWYFEKELESGASEADILEYPTVDVIRAMHAWMEAGQPD